MAKRDYYDILGINQSSSKEEIKKHTALPLLNIIPIKTLAIKLLKRNLKKQVKLIVFFQMTIKKKIMINLVTQLLRVEVEVVKGLVVLIHLLFLTFLKTFLEIFQMDLEGQAGDLRVVEAMT